MRYAILFIVCLVGGCAQLPDEVHATPQELLACRAAHKGCSVWTDDELNTVMMQVLQRGVQYGRDLESGEFND